MKNNVLQWSVLFASAIVLFLTGCSKSAKDRIPAWRGIHNAHVYVDLGLSVKWATVNIGTNSPYDFGNFYKWGETSAVDPCKNVPYKYIERHGRNRTITKYYCDGENDWNYFGEDDGVVDNKTTLELADDVAAVKWGGQWRMPTFPEWQELEQNCYWEWCSDYQGQGARGWLVFKAKSDADKGKKLYELDKTPATACYSVADDAHIFLPTVGVYSQATKGCYWSSSLWVYRPCRARSMFLDCLNVSIEGGSLRETSQMVRAVCSVE
ncbi:MAG: hypothetical protein E7070_10085 [Bacteroidales bacterium]|jgi:hypothetical protein|nr:hypothetical protein [Bacteroidales bacterium]